MSMKKSGINWDEIGVDENLLFFSVGNPIIRITFKKYLGSIIKQMDEKDVVEYRFEVIDLDVVRGDNKKIFPIISKPLMRKLREHEPFIGKSIEIRKVGVKYDTHYLLKPINLN